MKLVCFALVFGSVYFVEGFLLEDSCEGRCNAGQDRDKPCQCNSACVKFNDCCSDYSELCVQPKDTSQSPGSSGGCARLTDVTENLWKNDVDRLSTSEVKVNYQASLDYSDYTDKADDKLFRPVDRKLLTSKPVYSTYLALLDNYVPDKYSAETVTSREQEEEKAFLDAILATSVMDTLYDYLKCQGQVRSKEDLRTVLRRLWFELYRRSGGRRRNSGLDTSGFEHVMLGEYKSGSELNGFHYWLAFYELERTGEIEYYGRTCSVKENTVCPRFEWDGRLKQRTSFFLRSSPAFDIAIYSLCFLTYPNAECSVRVDGEDMIIQTYSKDGHISTAYIKL